VDLSSYAELAVRLANTDGSGPDDSDRLTDLDALRALVSDLPHLNVRVNRNDLDGMLSLRTELRKIFSAAAAGDGQEAVELLNALLILHPVHPQLSDHDGQRWHLHLTESGTVADKYAAGAAMGLAVVVTKFGMERLGVCEAGSCGSAFLDTTSKRCRRYCSDRCANQSNVAAYRARQRDEGDHAPSTAR
jgi:predicted RNA-binding Zn ribbon-like protein